MNQETINKMRVSSPLLPEPGGEVVCQCLDEIERLRSTNAKLLAVCDDVIRTNVTKPKACKLFIRDLAQLVAAIKEAEGE